MTLEEILAQLDQLDSLDTDQLNELEDAIKALYEQVRDGDLEDEDVAALEELAGARRKVKERIAAKADEKAKADERLAELDAEMADDDAEGDADGEDGDGEGSEDGDDADSGEGDDGDADGGDEGGDDAGAEEGAGDREPVLASGSPAARRLGRMAQRQSRRSAEAPAAASHGTVITAAAGVPDMAPGAQLTTPEAFGRALAAMHDAVGPFAGQKGDPFQKFPALTMRREFAADLTIGERMNADQATEVMDRAIERHIAAVNSRVGAMGDDVVLAAGGPCVDPDPDFAVDFIGTTGRPFTSAFPGVRYPRGRVSYYPPLCFDGSDAGTTFAQIGRHITQAQDEAGYGSDDGGPLTDPKGCVRIDCPDSTTCGLEIFIKCLTIGNWIDRTFPEYVRAWQQLIDVYYDRKLEQRHMAAVVSGSAVVTDGPSPFGAALSLSSAVMRIIAHNGSARRTPNRQWRLIGPSWATLLLKIDLMRYLNATANGLAGLNVTDAQVVSLLRNAGVNYSTYVDEAGPTTQGDAQLLSLISSGPVPELPGSARFFLFPEGQWVRGTGGELSTGVIRDSSLISSNDFQTFFEEWTAMCQRGCAGDSYVLDAELCPSGVSGGTVVLDCDASGSS